MRKLLILTLTILFTCTSYAINHEEYQGTQDLNPINTIETDSQSSALIAGLVENGQVVAASELPIIFIETQQEGDIDLPIYVVSEVSYSSIEEILKNSPTPPNERLPVLVLAGLDSAGAIVSVDAVVAGSVHSIMRPPLDEELLPPIKF